MAARRGATPRRHDLVALRRDQSRGRERVSNELNCLHAMAKKQTDRSPPVQIQGQSFERVKWSDQDSRSAKFVEHATPRLLRKYYAR